TRFDCDWSSDVCSSDLQQEFIAEMQKMGTPVGSLNVQGDIEFQSQFFEPTGNFHAHINYPTRGAEISVAISHPVGRWQIDNASRSEEHTSELQSQSNLV